MTQTTTQAPPIVRLGFAPFPDLPALTSVAGAVDEVWLIAYGLACYREVHDVTIGERSLMRFERPPVLRISSQSPAWVELAGNLAAPVGVSGLAFGIFRYLLSHPAELGGFVPRVVEAWHAGWSDALLERDVRREILSATAAGTGPRAKRPLATGKSADRITAHLLETSQTLQAYGLNSVRGEGLGSDWTPP